MFSTLKAKIRFAVLLIVVLFTFFTLWYFPKQEGNYLLKTYNNDVQNLANTVALGVKIALNEDNYEGVQTAMEYVKGKPNMRFVSLVQTDTIWNDAHSAFTIKESIFKTFPADMHPAANITSNDSFIVKRADFNTNLMTGKILLAFSTQEINDSKKEIRYTSLLVSAGILLVGFIVSIWLSRSISRPLEELRNAAQRVGKGDLSTVLKNYANDEIGDLTKVFNKMVSDLAGAREELNNSNKTLSETNTTLSKTLNDLKATQAQLIQSEKMASLGELTAGIAHEIQNPLNFVNNFAELNNELIEEIKSKRAAAEKRGDAEEDDLLNDMYDNNEKIAHHGKRADAIVKGMLQHSRTNSGQKEPTDINALCDEYLRLSYHGLRAKDKSFNADFKTDFDNLIGEINIVPQDIGRVLLNLFNNAFYAVKPPNPLKGGQWKPLVSVTTRKIKFANNSAAKNSPSGDGGIEIVVSDNGSGIPQNIIDKIFQPFFTTKPTGEGTGLGLSLAYDIVTKQHNGTLQVESKEGEGTVFIIVLPV